MGAFSDSAAVYYEEPSAASITVKSFIKILRVISIHFVVSLTVMSCPHPEMIDLLRQLTIYNGLVGLFLRVETSL
jgi:hypothetical protein